MKKIIISTIFLCVIVFIMNFINIFNLVYDIMSTSITGVDFGGNFSEMRNVYEFPKPSESLKPRNFLRYGVYYIKNGWTYNDIKITRSGEYVYNSEIFNIKSDPEQFEIFYKALISAVKKMTQPQHRDFLMAFLSKKTSITFIQEKKYSICKYINNNTFNDDKFYFSGAVFSDNEKYFIRLDISYDKFIYYKYDHKKFTKESFWDRLLWKIRSGMEYKFQ